MVHPLCSEADSTCRYLGAILAIGYQCIASTCVPCPVGTYGVDGSSCLACPTMAWSPIVGSSACSDSFTYSSPGHHNFQIPPGVTTINVKLWGGGSEGSYIYDSGDFKSCNLPVTSGQNLYVIVGRGSGLIGPDADNIEGKHDLRTNESTSRIQCT
jgi:hypothetical protein